MRLSPLAEKCIHQIPCPLYAKHCSKHRTGLTKLPFNNPYYSYFRSEEIMAQNFAQCGACFGSAEAQSGWF